MTSVLFERNARPVREVYASLTYQYADHQAQMSTLLTTKTEEWDMAMFVGPHRLEVLLLDA